MFESALLKLAKAGDRSRSPSRIPLSRSASSISSSGISSTQPPGLTDPLYHLFALRFSKHNTDITNLIKLNKC